MILVSDKKIMEEKAFQEVWTVSESTSVMSLAQGVIADKYILQWIHSLHV